MVEKEISPLPAANFDLGKVQDKLRGIKSLADLTGPGGAVQELLKQALELVLKAEQDVHLGYEPYKKAEDGPTNSRNGYSKKKLKTSSGPIEISVPRDREGTFEPQIVQKHQRIDPDLERRITGMYARGMSTRDIQAQLEEFYGTDVSPMLISRVTDKLLDGIKEWQARPAK